MIDASASTPLYEQIKAHLLRQIQSGAYLPGQRIPSERALSDTLGVNRLTVKKAISDLVQAGYLSVHIGKGTYVSERKFDLQLETCLLYTSPSPRD